MMDEATIAQTILSAWLFSVFLGFLIWGIRSGQFKNIEEAKYQMFKHQKTAGKTLEDGQKQ